MATSFSLTNLTTAKKPLTANCHNEDFSSFTEYDTCFLAFPQNGPPKKASVSSYCAGASSDLQKCLCSC